MGRGRECQVLLKIKPRPVSRPIKSRPEISVLSTKSRLAYKSGIIDAFIEVADLIGQEQEILDELKFEARS
jgi:hypothetical protein